MTDPTTNRFFAKRAPCGVKNFLDALASLEPTQVARSLGGSVGHSFKLWVGNKSPLANMVSLVSLVTLVTRFILVTLVNLFIQFIQFI